MDTFRYKTTHFPHIKFQFDTLRFNIVPKGDHMGENSILNSINTENTWVDVDTVAALKNISKRAVRLSLNNNKYEYTTEKTRGGKTYKIKLSSLEPELQIKYIQEYYDDFKTAKGEVIELSNFEIKQEKLITEKQKKIALAKYDIVLCWLEFRRNYKKDKIENISADHKFIELFNTGFLYEHLYNIIGKVSYGTLYRWRAALKGNDDWTSLVGRYKYSTHQEYNTRLNDEQIQIFLKILLSPNAFSIGKSITLAKHILKERGYEILPKDVTFQKVLIFAFEELENL